jgi:tetratricopeptide (TPR) repeat protein
MPKKPVAVSFGALYRSPRLQEKSDVPCFVYQRRLIVHPFRSQCVTPSDIEKQLAAIIRKRSAGAWWRLAVLLSAPPALMMAAVGSTVLILLGVLHTYEESFFETVRNSISLHTSRTISEALVGSFAGLLLLLVVSPTRLKAEEIDPRKKVNEWLSGESRAQKRISMLVSYLIKRKYIESVELWDAGIIEPWLRSCVIACARTGGLMVRAQVSCVQRDITLSEKHLSTPIPTILERNILDNGKPADSVDVDLFSSRLDLLSITERRAAELIPACSVNISDDTALVSLGLLGALVSQQIPDFGVEHPKLLQFVNRFCQDAGLGYWWRGFLVIRRRLNRGKNEVGHDRNGVDTVGTHIEKILDNVVDISRLDSLGCAVVAQYSIKSDRFRQFYRQILRVYEALIQKVRENEEYVLGPIVKGISDMLDRRSGFATGERAYMQLSIKALDNLSLLLERHGDFEVATDIARSLMSINEIKYGVRVARLLERVGQIGAAVVMIDGLLQLSVGRVGTAEEWAILYVEAAWIYVNAKRPHTEMAARRLLIQAYKHISEISDETPVMPTLRWRYWNIMYNLYEWEGEYDAALPCLEHCLRIPGIDVKWRSATYANLGIAYRNIWESEQEDWALRRALYYGRKGFTLKIRSGDFDEVPISGYHLALSMYRVLSKRMTENVSYRAAIASIVAYCELSLERTRGRKKDAELKELWEKVTASMSMEYAKKARERARSALNDASSDHRTAAFDGRNGGGP